MRVWSQASPVYAGLYMSAFLILAFVTVVKDTIFSDAKKKLGGKSLDLVGPLPYRASHMQL